MKRSEALACRLRKVRLEMDGKSGVPLLAEALEFAARTWVHYECGVTIPGMVRRRSPEWTWYLPGFPASLPLSTTVPFG